MTGAWWDYVDPIAAVGTFLTTQRPVAEPMIRQWSLRENIWMRRTAILAQLKCKKATDPHLIFDCIRPSMTSTEFFLQKAIGWSLHEHSKTEPGQVVGFVSDNSDELSNLSKREGLKTLLQSGVVESIP